MTDGAIRERRIHIVQGEYKVSDDPAVVVSTLLGSCVAACIRDPLAGVGGMNHFLLPGEDARSYAHEAERYGDYLMELLVNGLMKQGAHRDRLEAKLFGGARMMRGLSDIGLKNAEFAERYLKYEGIKLVGKDLGGQRGRRLQYWPVSGRARQSYVLGGQRLDDTEIVKTPPSRSCGDIELF
ncbi:MAG: chemotaxis protein CheD [Roseiarcus sp.]|jgi:chemotaxis protein CheD